MDLVIVVDNTQSQCIGDTTFDGETCDQWKKVLNYVSKIVTFLQIGSPDNNIALVKLSATPALIGRGFVLVLLHFYLILLFLFVILLSMRMYKILRIFRLFVNLASLKVIGAIQLRILIHLLRILE